MPQIALFNLVAKHLRFVAASSHLANQHLARYMEEQGDVTLVNIGIGTGRQEVALLELLEGQGTLPRKLTVHAIEPSADALQAAEVAIGEVCQRLGVELVFHPYLEVVEQIADADWQQFVPESGKLLVNASYALHHIRGEGDESGLREAIFHKIRRLNPAAVVICEPHSDHYTPDLLERFGHCWRHFAMVFDYIDQLGLAKEEVIGLKMFFAREIEDILGNHEERRYERHEPAETWVQRMRNSGLTLYGDLTFLEKAGGSSVDLTMRDGYVGLDYKGETIIAVICGEV